MSSQPVRRYLASRSESTSSGYGVTRKPEVGDGSAAPTSAVYVLLHSSGLATRVGSRSLLVRLRSGALLLHVLLLGLRPFLLWLGLGLALLLTNCLLLLHLLLAALLLLGYPLLVLLLTSLLLLR